MSEEWTFKPEVVEENLQIILQELRKDGKEPSESVAIVEERLIAALDPPPTIALSVAYVSVTFAHNYVVAKTVLIGTKHYEGNCSNETWGGASSGFLTMSKTGKADYIAVNTQDRGRGGTLVINFKDGGKNVGQFSGRDLGILSGSAHGSGTMWT